MVRCFDKRAGFFTGGVDPGKKRTTATPLSVNSAKEEPFFGVDRSEAVGYSVVSPVVTRLRRVGWMEVTRPGAADNKRRREKKMFDKRTIYTYILLY